MPIDRAPSPAADAAYRAVRRFVIASSAGGFTQWDMLTALCRIAGDIAAGAAKDDDERDAMIELCAAMIKAQYARRKAAP